MIKVVEMPLQSGEALNGVEGSSLPINKPQVKILNGPIKGENLLDH